MNKYLEKLAEVTRNYSSDAIIGAFSPALMKREIAVQHGHKGTGDTLARMGATHIGGWGRALGRGTAEGIAGAGTGFLTGAIASGLPLLYGKKVAPRTLNLAAAGTGLLGGLYGAGHGAYASLRNQAEEFHNMYEHEKKAALDALVEAGMDFDVAANLVKQAEKALLSES